MPVMPTSHQARRVSVPAIVMRSSMPCDRQPDIRLDREAVYAAYLARQLPGTRLLAVRMTGLRLPRLPRRDGEGRWRRGRVMPIADMAGAIEVVEPAALAAAMLAGIGRQRGFGFGMLRLRPRVGP